MNLTYLGSYLQGKFTNLNEAQALAIIQKMRNSSMEKIEKSKDEAIKKAIMKDPSYNNTTFSRQLAEMDTSFNLSEGGSYSRQM